MQEVVAQTAAPASEIRGFDSSAFWADHKVPALIGLAALLLLAVVLVQARRHRRSEKLAEEQRHFSSLVKGLLLAFATMPLEGIDQEIEAGLKYAGEVIGADDVLLWEPADEGDRAWMPVRLKTGGTVTFEDGECPPSLRPRLVRMGAGATVTATPVIVGGDVAGAIFWILRRGPLAPYVVEGLSAVGETFARVLERKRAASVIDQGRLLKEAVLRSLTSSLAVLNRDGVILEVNEAWKRFSQMNVVGHGASMLPGTSYRQVCERAVLDEVPGAAELLAGLNDVCAGRTEEFGIEIRGDGPVGECWFALRVSPLRREEGGAVIVHSEITAQKRAERVLRTVSGRLIAAQEAERRRIARELHDDLGQRVTLLAIEIEQTAMESGDGMSEQIRALGERTAGIATEIHRLSHDLHSAKLDALGLMVAVRGHCREMKARGLEVVFSEKDVPAHLPQDVALTVFRVVQESLNNVLKHAHIAQAAVHLQRDGQMLTALVVDVGQGFDVNDISEDRGIGLVGMRERLGAVGGTLKIQSRPGAGTIVQAAVPLPQVPGGPEPRR